MIFPVGPASVDVVNQVYESNARVRYSFDNVWYIYQRLAFSRLIFVRSICIWVEPDDSNHLSGITQDIKGNRACVLCASSQSL